MTILKFVVATCLALVALGLLVDMHVNAAIPNPCPQYNCKNVTVWWTGSKTVVYSAWVPGGIAPSVTGWANIFTQSSTFDLPNNATGKTYDSYTYAACAPTCGKDANGVWQALQEVSPSGNKMLAATGAAQFSCKYVGPSLGGTVANPVNANKDKNTPPGN